MRFKLLLIGLALFGVAACCSHHFGHHRHGGPATQPATTASKPATKPTSSTLVPASASASGACLRCHPWASVIEASAKYVTPEGDKTNPHINVPHDSKKEADIPDCLKCHTTHSLSPEPKKSDIDLKKVSVKWCYDACHHEKNFEKCSKCH